MQEGGGGGGRRGLTARERGTKGVLPGHPREQSVLVTGMSSSQGFKKICLGLHKVSLGVLNSGVPPPTSPPPPMIMQTYEMSPASRAGPISDRVVNPVALQRGAAFSVYTRIDTIALLYRSV